MASWTYALLDLGTLFAAVAMGLYWRQEWLRRWRRTLVSIGVISFGFWLWDIVATDAGQWAFSEAYTLGPKFLGLPVEEYAFFVVVGLACLAIWQKLHTEHAGRRIALYWLLLPVGAAVGMNLLWLGSVYTFAVAGTVYATCLLFALFGRGLLTTTWVLYQAVQFSLFAIFNTILSALPVVIYNPDFFSNVRLGTIPLEDVLYNFALINLVVLVYAHVHRRRYL